MAKPKLEKFEEINSFPNVFQNRSYNGSNLINHQGEKIDLKGKWASDYFKNDQPICLELACGRGEYSLNLARQNSEVNYIGLDIKGNRLWTGAKAGINEGLNNLAYLRTDIVLLEHLFAAGEINEIWILFPDPYLKKSKAQKRLTSQRFIEIYRKVGIPNMQVNLKTDDPTLYAFTLEVIEELNLDLLWSGDDIYSSELPTPELEIKTYYEGLHLKAGKTIKFIRFRI
jgi:tRNA (guanine-N7-)-methyltransferase